MPVWAPYVQTKSEVVKQMLEMAGTSADDIVVDLGCGDGRICIAAAKEYGARFASFLNCCSFADF